MLCIISISQVQKGRGGRNLQKYIRFKTLNIKYLVVSMHKKSLHLLWYPQQYQGLCLLQKEHTARSPTKEQGRVLNHAMIET